jgi:hypothetical protein
MEFSRKKIIFIVLIILVIIAILVGGIFFGLRFLNNKKIKTQVSKNNVLAAAAVSDVLPPQKLKNPPKIIKAVYVTGYSAGSKSYTSYLNNLLNSTEINAVVIDIKGSDGYVTYNSSLADVQKYKLTNYAISNIDALVRSLHDKNIYVIGRIAVFEDPVYAKVRPELAVYNKADTLDLSNPVLWQDRNGLSWMDPASKDVWDYDISLAKDALNNHGFDEINFDYVRFPTDGKTGDAGFPVYDGVKEKSEVIKEFFGYLRQQLLNEKISVDLFGLTTVKKDDMGIGQIIEDAFLNFDYISPMVYPSHYADEFIGFANPADHPYDVIKYSMDHALSRENAFLQQQNPTINNATGTASSETKKSNIVLAKFRPWLQDFDMGAYYTADMIDQEIKATQDSLGNDFVGFMLWNPRNIYTEEAVPKPN